MGYGDTAMHINVQLCPYVISLLHKRSHVNLRLPKLLSILRVAVQEFASSN